MANLSNTVLGNTTPLARKSPIRLGPTELLNRRSRFAAMQSTIAHDLPVYSPTKTISGTIYTAAGTGAAGATVKLFRQMDDLLCKTTTTDGAGHYSFARDADDVFVYYVVAYTSATSPQVHGVSDRGSVPA